MKKSFEVCAEKMKLLGANDDMNGGRGPSSHRSQDDAAVGYVFQRHPHETADFPHFSHKQAPQPPRWASGDETIIDVSISIRLLSFIFRGCCCLPIWFLIELQLFLFGKKVSWQTLMLLSILDVFMEWCWHIVSNVSIDCWWNSKQNKWFFHSKVYPVWHAITVLLPLTFSYFLFSFLNSI